MLKDLRYYVFIKWMITEKIVLYAIKIFI